MTTTTTPAAPIANEAKAFAPALAATSAAARSPSMQIQGNRTGGPPPPDFFPFSSVTAT